MDLRKKTAKLIRPNFPDQSINQAKWLVKARWLIAFSAIGAVFIVSYLQVVDLRFVWLYSISSSLLILNTLYYFHLKFLEKKSQEAQEKSAIVNIHWQIGLDFLILTFLIHFSGGIENPCIIFYVFHMIIGCIILPVRGAVFQSLFAIVLFTSLSVLEYFGTIPHYTLNEYISSLLSSDPGYLFFALAVFAFTSLLLVYFTVTLAERMRFTKSELSRTNEQLKAHDTIKNEYVYRVTHNIKSDLSTISSCLSVVNQKILAPLDSKNEDFVNKAFQRTKNLMHFVDDLLSLTNMRLSNRYDMNEFNVTDLVSEVFYQFENLAKEKNLRYNLNGFENEIVMVGMRVSVREAVLNLISNAIKYTPNSGTVSVSLRKFKNAVIISISDSGYGIPYEEQPYIFNEFFRAKNVKEQEGTGVGLALVKAIVERHKGKILVNSELNRGSEFTLLFYGKQN